jgi:hypothetical protein
LHHTFFIHLSEFRNLDWFHNFTIVNSAAVHMDVQGSLLFADLQ